MTSETHPIEVKTKMTEKVIWDVRGVHPWINLLLGKIVWLHLLVTCLGKPFKSHCLLNIYTLVFLGLRLLDTDT